MIGVVLWSDDSDSKAVIWCEDHGHLAYYCATHSEKNVRVQLESGDLVMFDLTGESDVRRASNPRVVAQEQFPTLVSDLTGTTTTYGEQPCWPLMGSEEEDVYNAA